MICESVPQQRWVGFIPFRMIRIGLFRGVIVGRFPVEEYRVDHPDRWEPEWRPVRNRP